MFFLSKHKYIRDLLEKTSMVGIKASVTHMSTSTKIVVSDGFPLANATAYDNLISGMQYLSLTHPDFAYAINKLAQYMPAPTQIHWPASKRLFRYLKHTLHLGLHFSQRQCIFIF